MYLMKRTLLSACTMMVISSTFAFADDALLKQAESGDAKAQFEVAEMYTSGKLGKNTTEDRAKAIEWLEKSAQQGFEKAQETLCIEYISVNKYEKVLKWAKLLADKGNNIGKSSLAFLLYIGGGVIPVDRSKAFALIKETGNEPLSKAILGLYYISGWFDFESDLEKAKSLAKEAIDAKLCLGYKVYLTAFLREFILSKGSKKDLLPIITKYSHEGLTKFPESYDFKIYEAVKDILDESNLLGVFNGMALLKEAELRGVKEVYPFLVMCESVSGNQDKAADYLIKAAEPGYTDLISQYFDSFNALPNAFDLCVLGQTEMGVKKPVDLIKAKEIINKSLANNSPELIKVYYPMLKMARSRNSLRKRLGDVFDENFDFDKYLKIAADNGSPDMVFLYSKQFGLSKEEQDKYIIGAANMGCIDAMEALAYKYYKEKSDKAFYWADKAAKYKKLKNDYYNEDISSLVKGFCYLDGICGVEKNIKEGLLYLGNYESSGGNLDYSYLLFEKYSSLEENNKNIQDAFFWANVALKRSKLTNTSLRVKLNNYLEYTKSKLSKKEIDSVIQAFNNDFLKIYDKNRNHIRKHCLYTYGDEDILR